MSFNNLFGTLNMNMIRYKRESESVNYRIEMVVKYVTSIHGQITETDLLNC